MSNLFWKYLLVPVLLSGSALSAAVFGSDTPARSLFNGRDLNGWVIEGEGNFSVEDGRIILNKGTGWLRTEETFGDATFLIEFRFIENEANSGIFVRTGPTSDPKNNDWPDNGYQIQCMDTTEGPYPLGSMIPYGAPPFEAVVDTQAIQKAYKPARQWQTLEITCQGEAIRIKLNGVPVTSAWSIRNRGGHLGLQGEHGKLEFLRIEVLEAPANQSSETISH